MQRVEYSKETSGVLSCMLKWGVIDDHTRCDHTTVPLSSINIWPNLFGKQAKLKKRFGQTSLEIRPNF
jgi:hypothetical protein